MSVQFVLSSFTTDSPFSITRSKAFTNSMARSLWRENLRGRHYVETSRKRNG